MANIATYLANKLLDHAWGKTAYTMPTTYVALYTVAPSAGGGGTEVSGGSYVREALSGLLAAAASGANATNADVVWPTATADWGTIVAIGVLDASSAGNLLMFGNLAVSKTVLNGDTFKITSGNLTDTLS